MSTFTDETLLELIVAEIDKRITVSEVEVVRGIIAGGGSVTTKDLAQVVDTIQEALSEGIKPRIMSGLDVTATSPPSQSVNVALGKGFVAGKLVELTTNQTLAIPTDPSAQLFYINLDRGNSLTVDRGKFTDRLVLARIIIPKPGVTSIILDDKPKEPTAIEGWIVSGKDAVFDADQEFDEDSIEAIKNVITPILAETIVGTIQLSEQLKILSTLGTVEIDAQEIRIKYANGTVGAKLSKQGTFFFDENGLERARFTATDAAIGNAVTINTDGLELIGPKGLTVVQGGEIRVAGGEGTSTLINSSKIFIGQQITGQGVDLASADGTQIFIDINGVDGEFIKPETIDAKSIKALTITAEQLAANSITAGKIATKEITADKFNSTLFGDLNQAIRYAKAVLTASAEFDETMTTATLDAGTKNQVSTASDQLKIATQDTWDDDLWDTGTWDVPIFASGDWTSASQDLGSSATSQLTISAQISEDNSASTSIVVKAQYSTDNVSFGANSPTFDDGLFETLTESAIGGGSNFRGSIFSFRYFKVKIELTTLNTNDNITLSSIRLQADQVNLTAFKDRVTIAAAGTEITYSGYSSVPAVIPSVVGNYPGLAVVTTKSTTAATIKVFSGSAMTNVGGVVDVQILGA